MTAIGRLTYRHQRQVEVLGQDAAEQQADGAAGAGDGAEDRRTPWRARRASVKVVVSSDSAAGASSAPKMPWSGAGGDQHLEVLRGAAEGGGAGEADQADEEDRLAAEQVGYAAAEQQQAAERQGVGGDDPLPVVVGEAEVLLRGGQRDVHDGRVQDDHELGEADDGEDPPAPRAGRRCGRLGVTRSGHAAVIDNGAHRAPSRTVLVRSDLWAAAGGAS